MPPQVGKAGEGTRPVVTQTPEGVDQTKSSELKMTTEPQESLSNSSTTQTHRASPEEKTRKLKELSVRGDTTKATLNNKLKALNTEGTKTLKSIEHESPAVIAEQKQRFKDLMSKRYQEDEIKQEVQMQTELRQIRADTQKNISRKE